MAKQQQRFPPASNHYKSYLFSVFIALVLSGAFWLQNTSKAIRQPSTGAPAEFYANQNGDDLTQIFVKAIEKAEQSVLLVVYSFTDHQIIASLRKKAQEGLNVRVICDAKASPYIDSKLGSKVNVMRRFGPGLMHQKILVIDGQQTWLGSANMTTESLRMHGNLVAAVQDASLAKAVTNKALTLKVEGHDRPFFHENFNIGNQEIELWFLPDNYDASMKLKTLIRSAKKTIRVAMFTWTRQDFAKEIIEAYNRGVQTEVVIDHYSGKGASAKVVQAFKKAGVPVFLSQGGPLLHHKFLYIDGELLVNGSANWTKAAFNANDDCFMIFHDLTAAQQSCMESLWRTIRAEAIKPN